MGSAAPAAVASRRLHVSRIDGSPSYNARDPWLRTSRVPSEYGAGLTALGADDTEKLDLKATQVDATPCRDGLAARRTATTHGRRIRGIPLVSWRVEGDRTVRAVVVTGTHRVCVGGDSARSRPRRRGSYATGIRGLGAIPGRHQPEGSTMTSLAVGYRNQIIVP